MTKLIDRHRKLTAAFGLVVSLALLPISRDQSASAKDYGASKAAAESLRANFEEPTTDQVTLDSLATLGDYLALAATRSPALRNAYYEWEAALKSSDYAGALPDPQLSYGYFIENVETRVGPQQQRFSLRQAFPWFGTLGAKHDVASAEALAAEQRFESVRQRLFYEVKSAYYDLYYLGQELAITQENFDLLSFWQEVVQTRYKVGLNQHPDLIKVQVELGILEDQLSTLQEKVRPYAAKLRALLDLPATAQIGIPQVLGLNAMPLDSEQTIAAVRKDNPSLRAMEYMIEKAEAGLNLSRKSSLPQLSLGVDFIQTGEALDPTLPESGKDPWIVNASISLPLWFGKNRARTQEAEARRRAAEYRREDSEVRLVAFAERLVFEHANALRKVNLYQAGLVPKAEQSLNATYSAYQSGEADFLDLLEAQRQLLNFQLTVEREKVNQARAEAELEMLTGRSIDDLVDNSQNQNNPNGGVE